MSSIHFNNFSNKLSEFLKSPKSIIMGILNITTDSFSGDGLYLKDTSSDSHFINKAIERIQKMIDAGCMIIDIGAESTRPGFEPVQDTDEIKRIVPVLTKAQQLFPDIIFSIDTTKTSVAKSAIQLGAAIINDVNGIENNHDMLDLAIKYQSHVVLMHRSQKHRKNQSLQTDNFGSYYINDSSQDHYNLDDFLNEVYNDLKIDVSKLLEHGVSHDKIIIDVGIGFDKTPHENLFILANLERFNTIGCPMLLGASRKSFIGFACDAKADQRLGGSIASLTIAIMKGAKIIRVHDYNESVQAAKLCDHILQYQK